MIRTPLRFSACVISGLCLWLAVFAHGADPTGMTADEALQRLKDGNTRFVAGKATHERQQADRRTEVAKGQSPFAIIVCCSDSRVPPEIVFDQGLGDLFVLRTAGNVVDDIGLGTIEYAVEHLHTRLVVVLGHDRCGAVSAAVAGGEAQGHVQAIVKAIRPAVEEVKGQPGDPVANAVTANVKDMVKKICTTGPILPDRIRTGKLTVIGARYDLDDGHVEFFETKGPPKKLAVDLGSGVKMTLVLIPAGEFMMGSGESAEDTAAFFNKNYGENPVNADDFKDGHPQHRVRITKPFYLATYHVTRGQFRQFVAATAYKTDAEKGERPGAFGWNPDTKETEFNEKYSWRNAGFEQTDEHPVVNVSWNDAVAFCKWLSKKEGKTYRLPTEAEWEYACRAGTTTRYYSGDDPQTLAKVGNMADAAAKAQFPDWTWTIKANDGYVFTAPVGKFKPNAFGLYDMHGNAWQWCADWYGEEYYAASPADDSAGPDSGNDRVLRGGSWGYGPDFIRSATRYRDWPRDRDNYTGFRVARTQ